MLTTVEVARKYGITPTAVWHAIKAGTVRATEIPLGTQRRIFLLEPEDAERRWGAGSRPRRGPKPRAQTAA